MTEDYKKFNLQADKWISALVDEVNSTHIVVTLDDEYFVMCKRMDRLWKRAQSAKRQMNRFPDEQPHAKSFARYREEMRALRPVMRVNRTRRAFITGTSAPADWKTPQTWTVIRPHHEELSSFPKLMADD